jgi:peptidyl-prolyl cis-trans isomerase C
VKKTTTMLTALALVAGGAFAQTPAAKPAASTATTATAASDADPIVITAGNLKVRKSEFEAAIASIPEQYRMNVMQDKKAFAEDYVRMKLLAAEGMKNGIDKTPEVATQISLMHDNLVANAQISAIDKTIVVGDADLRQFYDAHKNEFEQAKARHILIAFKGSRAAQPGKKELTDEEAKAKAEDLRKKIVAGSDFAALAKAESDDVSSGAQGGDLGTFSRGQMVPEFDKAAFETKVGEVSPVIRTEYGYHILQVQEHTTTPFDQVKPSIEKNLHQDLLKAKLDAMKTASAVTLDDTYFGMPRQTAPAGVAPAANTDVKKPAASKQ